jgi:hypothetical protein
VPEERIQRVKRRCANASPDAKRRRTDTAVEPVDDISWPTQAAIEIQGPDGQWAACEPPGGTVPNPEPQGLGQATEPEEEISIETQIFDVVPTSSRLMASQDLDSGMIVSYQSTTSGNCDIISRPLLEPSVPRVATPVPLSPPFDWAQFWLQDLPSNRLEKKIHQQEVDLQIGKHLWARLTGATTITDVAVKLLKNGDITSTNVRSLTRTLQTIVPGDTASGGLHDSGPLVTEEVMFETKICRALIFCIANGFAGLDRIATLRAAETLGHLGPINSLLFSIFQDAPKHVAKALAENLIPRRYRS